VEYNKKIKIIFLIIIGFFGLYGIHQAAAHKLLFSVPVETDVEASIISSQRTKIASSVGLYFKKNEYPTEVDEVQIEYSLDPELQNRANSLLKRYKPDYGAIVVMNATTGEILALSSFEKGKENHENWALHGGFPAASVFKIVTASAALDKYGVNEETLIFFNGGSHTLYRKNVMSNQINRWTRVTTLKEAFAHSFNTPFGRLTFDLMSPQDIESYALKFGFNKQIQSDLPFDMGFTSVPDEKNFNLAEIASGFNRVTRMSPIQGAMIAASVVSEGVMPVPSIVRSLKDKEGNIIYESRPVTAATVLTPEGAEKLSKLMAATVDKGTSRKIFRSLIPWLRVSEIEVGGKTGSLTGNNPKGKVDWFIGYGKNPEGDKIAIAAITVNKQSWTVKSSYLARQMIEVRFKDHLMRTRFAERSPAHKKSY
jgi:cell division protein FtsI/penicillin-binding protein 2